MRRLFAVACAALAACGFLAPPGGYTSGESDSADADVDVAQTAPDAALQDVAPGSIGTLALLSGERNPTSPADDPAWAGDMWLASLDADGRVARYTIAKSAPVIGSFDAVGITGGKLFATNVGFGVGGGTGTALQSIVWGPGPNGEWTAAAAAMPGGLSDVARAFFGTHLVVVGGTRQVTQDGGTIADAVDEVHVADVNVANGTLSGMTNAGRSLGVARSRTSLVVADGRVYVIGGKTAPATITGAVEMASVDGAAGTVGTFSAQPAMMIGTSEHRVFVASALAHNGWLYVAGGRTNNANAPSAAVLVAKIDLASGILSSWKDAGSLPRALRDFAFVAHAGRLYVAGGILASGMRVDEVLSATMRPDGTLSSWDAANAKLPSPRSDFVAVAY